MAKVHVVDGLDIMFEDQRKNSTKTCTQKIKL